MCKRHTKASFAFKHTQNDFQWQLEEKKHAKNAYLQKQTFMIRSICLELFF